MKVRHFQRRGERIELKMTAMIDIVFLLLVFFIMTFTIAAPEGDFGVRMPVAAPGAERIDSPLIPPIQVRLVAGGTGHLAGIRLGGRDLGRDFNALNMQIRQIVGEDAGTHVPEAVEVEIDADYPLRFEYLMDAMTAVSGYRTPDGRIVKLCEKVKLAPPRTP